MKIVWFVESERKIQLDLKEKKKNITDLKHNLKFARAENRKR